MKKTGLFLCVFLCLVVLVSCSDSSVKTKTYYTYFDTVISIISYSKESKNHFEETCNQIENMLSYYNNLFDIYHEYSGLNNLCTVNKNAGKAVVVDPQIIELLEEAKTYYALTNGEVNIMMGPVLKLWHQTITESFVLPNIESLQNAAKYCNFEEIQIDKTSSIVKLKDQNASIDVGAIAKGFVTEKIAQYLNSHGLTSYAINAGGNVRLVGEKFKGVDWTVAIRNPNGSESDFSLILDLSDTSCVTSGVYERRVTIDGKDYHHIIDKDTLMPSNYFASVSVICQNSTCADALSTAFSCMSYEDGLLLANTLDNVEVIWIFYDGSIKYTNGVKALIHE